MARKNESGAGHKALSREDVSEFEAVDAQMQGFYEETRMLASKRPNDAVNKFKLGVANELLRRANKLLGDAKPLSSFTEFPEEELPSNSDVQMILSQYLKALEKLRSDHIEASHGYWYWVIDSRMSDVRTVGPKKLYTK